MARLPKLGGDDGSWGQILNDYLSQSHKADGTLKDNIVSSATLTTDAVDSTILKDGSITASKLSASAGSNGQALVKDSTSTGGLKWSTVSSGSSTPSGPAGGDLGGTYPNPTVPGLATKANSTDVYTKTQVDSSLATKANTTDVYTKAQVDTAVNAKYTKPSGGIPETDLDSATQAKIDATGVTTLDGLSDVSVAGATDGQVLLYSGGVWGPATNTAGGTGTISDATTTTKGIVQLAGDLGGTAGAPTVPGLAAKANSADVYTKTDVDTALAAKANSADVYTTTQVDAAVNAKYTKPSGGIPETDLDAATQSKLDATVDVSGKADKTTTITGTNSIAGGGDLSANRTLSLVNDNATPGNSKYYGTNSSGAKGFYSLPTGGGGSTFAAVAKTTTYTAANGDLVICDASAAGFNITLPTPANGAWVKVKKVDSTTNAVLVMAQNSATVKIDDQTSVSVNVQWLSYDFMSDGTKWYRV